MGVEACNSSALQSSVLPYHIDLHDRSAECSATHLGTQLRHEADEQGLRDGGTETEGVQHPADAISCSARFTNMVTSDLAAITLPAILYTMRLLHPPPIPAPLLPPRLLPSPPPHLGNPGALRHKSSDAPDKALQAGSVKLPPSINPRVNHDLLLVLVMTLPCTPGASAFVQSRISRIRASSHALSCVHPRKQCSHAPRPLFLLLAFPLSLVLAIALALLLVAVPFYPALASLLAWLLTSLLAWLLVWLPCCRWRSEWRCSFFEAPQSEWRRAAALAAEEEGRPDVRVNEEDIVERAYLWGEQARRHRLVASDRQQSSLGSPVVRVTAGETIGGSFFVRLGMQRQQGTCLVDDAHGRKPHHCLLLLCKGRRGRGPTRRLSCMLWCSRGGGRLLVLLQGEIHRFRGLQVPLAQRRGDGICEESGEEREEANTWGDRDRHGGEA